VQRDLVVELEGDDLADAVVRLELGQAVELRDEAGRYCDKALMDRIKL